MSKSQPILISNVMVLDSTGSEPFPGEVLVADERIVDVRRVPTGEAPEGAERVDGRGHTLMSGLCDAHTHFTWNEGDLDALATLPVEEHVLHSMRSARIYIDHGYTMCVGAASAKSRLDVVMRDAINRREIQGPRYLANGMEIAVTGGQLVSGITQFADGPDEMRKVVRETIALGVDTIKLSMSGEEITGRNRAADNYFSDEEVEAAVREAHRRGVRVAVHARAAESVRLALRHGADIIYHASFIDDEGMDMLEERKDSVFVAPGLNWLIATLNEAGDFGYPPAAAEAAGYKYELECAIEGLKEMKRRGIRILPGGDYGFAWTPHGTYARDLEHFVNLLGFTPMEAILSATALGGEIMMQPDFLGKILPGYAADMVLVDGNPLDDITILQDKTKIVGVMKEGRYFREFPTGDPIPRSIGADARGRFT